MPQQKSPEADTPAFPSTPKRELLEKFRGLNTGFQSSSRSSYRQHERWRNQVLRGLKVLETEGLVVVHQLIPCQRHGKCDGQPVAAGCELTLEGQRVRGSSFSPLSGSPQAPSSRRRSAGHPA